MGARMSKQSEDDSKASCTCRMSHVRSTDIDPPELILDKWCPVHGRDPDQAYEEWRDRQMMEKDYE
jgi:hypothetical protein